MNEIHDIYEKQFDELDAKYNELLEELRVELDDSENNTERNKIAHKIRLTRETHKNKLNALQKKYNKAIHAERQKIVEKNNLSFQNREIERRTKQMQLQFEYEQTRHAEMLKKYEENMKMHQSLYQQKSKEASSAQSKLQKFLDQQENIYNKYKAQKLEMIELQIQLKQLDHDRKEDQEQIERLNQQNAKLSRSMQEFKREKEELETKINEQIRDRDEIKSDLILTEENLVNVKSDICEHKNRIRSLKESVRELRARNISVEEARHIAEEKYNRLRVVSEEKLALYKRRLAEKNAVMVDTSVLEDIKSKYNHQQEVDQRLMRTVIDKVMSRTEAKERKLAENNPKLNSMLDACHRKNLEYQKQSEKLKAIIKHQQQSLIKLRNIQREYKYKNNQYAEGEDDEQNRRENEFNGKRSLLSKFKRLLHEYMKLKDKMKEHKQVSCHTKTQQYLSFIHAKEAMEKTSLNKINKQVASLNKILEKLLREEKEFNTSIYEAKNNERLSIRVSGANNFQRRQQQLIQGKALLNEKITKIRAKRKSMIASMGAHNNRLKNLEFIRNVTVENDRQIKKNNRFIQQNLRNNSWKFKTLDKNIQKLTQLIDVSQSMVNHETDENTPKSLINADTMQTPVIQEQQNIMEYQLRSLQNDQKELTETIGNTQTISEKARSYVNFVNNPTTSTVERKSLKDILGEFDDEDDNDEDDEDEVDNLQMLQNIESKLKQERERGQSLRAMIKNMNFDDNETQTERNTTIRRSVANARPTRKARNKEKTQKYNREKREKMYSIGRIHHVLANKPAIQSKIVKDPIVRERNTTTPLSYTKKVYQCNQFQSSSPCKVYKYVRKVRRANRLQQATKVKDTLNDMTNIIEDHQFSKHRGTMSEDDKVKLLQLIDEKRALTDEDAGAFTRSLQMRAFQEKIDRQYKDRVQSERDAIFREAKLIREKLHKAPSRELLTQYRSVLKNGENITLHRRLLLQEQVDEAEEWRNYLQDTKQKAATIIENLSKTLDEFPDPNGVIARFKEDTKEMKEQDEKNRSEYTNLLQQLQTVENDLEALHQECIDISRPGHYDTVQNKADDQVGNDEKEEKDITGPEDRKQAAEEEEQKRKQAAGEAEEEDRKQAEEEEAERKQAAEAKRKSEQAEEKTLRRAYSGFLGNIGQMLVDKGFETTAEIGDNMESDEGNAVQQIIDTLERKFSNDLNTKRMVIADLEEILTILNTNEKNNVLKKLQEYANASRAETVLVLNN